MPFSGPPTWTRSKHASPRASTSNISACESGSEPAGPAESGDELLVVAFEHRRGSPEFSQLREGRLIEMSARQADLPGRFNPGFLLFDLRFCRPAIPLEPLGFRQGRRARKTVDAHVVGERP